jgi:hypothetical protein
MMPAPGDVWTVRTGGIAAKLIRFGTALRYLFAGNPAPWRDNHVVIVIKLTDGVWWGIEGRPGGVGWADLTGYLNDPATVSNQDQPKTDAQRAAIVALVPQVLGTPYDWDAIMASAATDLHLPELFNGNPSKWGTTVPGHVICSSVASWMYDHLGMKAPTEGPDTQPSDWTLFDIQKGWL